MAEAKYRAEPERFGKMIREKDTKGLEEAITKKAVEEQVLKRLELKARTYGTDPSAGTADPAVKINVEAVVNMYRVSGVAGLGGMCANEGVGLGDPYDEGCGD